MPSCGRPKGTSANVNRDPRSLDPLAFPLHQYVMLDTETTGLDPRTGARLLEIGMARVKNDHVAEVFDTLVNPMQPIPPAITELTGLTDSDVRTAPDLAEAMRRFEQWLEPDDIIIAHNAPFDMMFLDLAIREATGNKKRFLTHLYVDTLSMSRLLHPERAHHSVVALIRAYGIGEGEEHRALSDALQEEQLYRILRGEAFGV